MQLYEKYRPERLDDLAGHGQAIAMIRRIIGRPGWDRDAFWIAGPSGTGKTTLGRAMGREVGCNPDDMGYEELDGDKCGVEEVHRLEDMSIGARLFDCWHVVIVNEAQAMTPKAVQAWLTFLERLPEKWLVVFTTTDESADLFGDYNEAFMRRVKPITLTKAGLRRAFGKRLKEIAAAEKMDGRPVRYYERVIGLHHCNMGSSLQALEMGSLPDAGRLTKPQQQAVKSLVRRAREKAKRTK